MAGLWCVGLVHTGARRMIDTSFSYNSYLILAYQNGEKYFLRTHTVFPHIRPAGIIILHSLRMRVLLENTTFSLHKIIRNTGIIRIVGIIGGRVLYEEIR